MPMAMARQTLWDAAARHADAWIKANRNLFDSWLDAARKAAQ